MQSAWKVGLFVVVFVGLLLGAYAVLEKNLFAKPTERYFADFADAGGVATGSAVFLSGVQVGQVKDVRLLGPKQARLTFDLDKGTQIPAGSTAQVPMSFISIGDTRVFIVPPEKVDGYLQPEAVLAGRLGSPLEGLAPEAGKTLEELNKTMVAVQGLLEDKSLKHDLHALMNSVTETSTKFGGVADRIDGLIASNEGRFKGLLTSTAGTLENMRLVSLELQKFAASGQLQDKTTALLDNLNETVKKGNALVGDLQSFVNDPDLRGSLKGTMENVKVMSESGPRIAADAEVMAKNGVEITAETKELMKKANKLADQVQEMIEKFNGTIDKIGQGGKSFASGLEYEATLTQESSPGRLRADANVFIPIGKDKVMIGLFDAFESNKINFQMVKSFGPNLGLRYGAYASKPGLGVDYSLAPRLGLRGDVFGLNDPRFDLRLNYQVGPGAYGWVGLNKIFERNSPSVGVTIRK
ncbi:MAG: MCE family protein [Armatimonadetes bacterium]|nr:MCE family protein [Armatimonadota bacterium]